MCSGYDGIPVDGMQGLDIGSHPGSTYGGGPVQDMDMEGSDLNFGNDMPQPPQDNNQVQYFWQRKQLFYFLTKNLFQVAAWYDTDL